MIRGMMAAMIAVPTALPVEKSQAWRMAMTEAITVQTQVMNGINDSMNGMKLKMLSRPGE